MRRKTAVLIAVSTIALTTLCLQAWSSHSGVRAFSRRQVTGEGYSFSTYAVFGYEIYSATHRDLGLSVVPEFEAVLRNSGTACPKELLAWKSDVQRTQTGGVVEYAAFAKGRR